MRYPGAIWRPWTPYTPERYITPRTVIVHTNAVNAEDPGPTGSLSWHFQVGEHGDIYQHRDTSTRAAANALANDFAISVETWDGGDPEGNPWNTAQLEVLAELIGWCCTMHHIPRTPPATWDAPGVGYHRMFNTWNQPYHSCPGDTRVNQFPDLLERLQPKPPPPPEEDDMHYLLSCPDAGLISLVDPASGFFLDFTTGSDVAPYSAAGIKTVGPVSKDHRTRVLQACEAVRNAAPPI